MKDALLNNIETLISHCLVIGLKSEVEELRDLKYELINFIDVTDNVVCEFNDFYIEIYNCVMDYEG